MTEELDINICFVSSQNFKQMRGAFLSAVPNMYTKQRSTAGSGEHVHRGEAWAQRKQSNGNQKKLFCKFPQLYFKRFVNILM